ncbi:hypothetical protein QOZ94_003403 [Xanthobacter agilis]|uniref:Uncharacterized protein n=1 Tax=Xanthobacter agilis TaxID=47492 RepID=A0ABU0LHH1_XANAG|nr:hypothetical protein [Xanthobacter agilis]
MRAGLHGTCPSPADFGVATPSSREPCAVSPSHLAKWWSNPWMSCVPRPRGPRRRGRIRPAGTARKALRLPPPARPSSEPKRLASSSLRAGGRRPCRRDRRAPHSRAPAWAMGRRRPAEALQRAHRRDPRLRPRGRCPGPAPKSLTRRLRSLGRPVRRGRSPAADKGRAPPHHALQRAAQGDRPSEAGRGLARAPPATGRGARLSSIKSIHGRPLLRA